jgi:hypothetical protein
MAIIKFSIISAIILILLCCSGCLKAPDTDGDGYRDPVDDFPDNTHDWKDSGIDGFKFEQFPF